MANNDNLKRKPVVVATVAASILMFTFGIGYRVLAARLSAPIDAASISPEALARLPLQIGDWTGQEVPLDEAIVQATDTDAHINRSYSRNNASGSVLLYIASGVRARDLMPHRPEVCYTGNGWTLVDRRSLELPLSEGGMLPCNVIQFSRGMLNTEKLVVLDYYIVDGQYCRDVSLLRSKAFLGQGTVRYVAQVQIVAPIPPGMTADSAIRTVRAFAVESALSIARLFEDAQEEQRSSKDRLDDPDPNLVLEGTENG